MPYNSHNLVLGSTWNVAEYNGVHPILGNKSITSLWQMCGLYDLQSSAIYTR